MKKAIYKAREIDLKATFEQLDLNESAYIPHRSDCSIEAIRTAASRLGSATGRKYSVSRTINGTIITRDDDTEHQHRTGKA